MLRMFSWYGSMGSVCMLSVVNVRVCGGGGGGWGKRGGWCMWDGGGREGG